MREFSIGFGPKLLGFRDKSGVVWKICILPFGGFVKFEGDLDPSSLSSKIIILQKILIILIMHQ